MKCEQAKEMISLYIDNVLSMEEKIEFEGHIKECKECYEEYLSLLEVVNSMNDIEEVPLPEGFRKELRHKLEETHSGKNTIKNKIRVRGFSRWTSIAAILLVGVFFTAFLVGPDSPFGGYRGLQSEMAGEGRSSSEDATMNMGSAEGDLLQTGELKNMDTHAESQEESVSDQSDQGIEKDFPLQNMQEKIIYSASITLQVNEFNQSFDDILQYVKDIGGFVQNSSTNNPDYGMAREGGQGKKEGYIFLRVPSEGFEEAIGKIEKMGNVKNKQRTGENITAQYRDIEVEVNNLEVQEKSLVEIMKKADKVQDILEIERELNRIRTEINQRQTTLKNWDQLVEYSSIEIYIQEEKLSGTNIEASPFKELGLKIQKGFIQSINFIVEGIVSLIIFIAKAIPFILIIVILYLIYRKWLRDRLKGNK